MSASPYTVVIQVISKLLHSFLTCLRFLSLSDSDKDEICEHYVMIYYFKMIYSEERTKKKSSVRMLEYVLIGGTFSKK